ncbi:MAG: hypothetical protein P4M09_15845 [Devosia sp.]|nr:hypothetical protein [Devosia sp.]
MNTLQIVSTALFAIALTTLPIIAWAMVMYSTLQSTGAMIGAFA